MNSRLDKIRLINQKVDLLVSSNKEKDEKIQQLNSEINSLTNSLNKLNQEIQTVKNENENLKTIGTQVEKAPKSNISQQEIDKMIKEIDECLALLNI